MEKLYEESGSENVVLGQKSMSNSYALKSARPGRITYVTLDEVDSELPQMPVRAKKSTKGLKIAGAAAGILFVGAATAYAGTTYYYSNRFFNGTTINGIDASGKTAMEVEQEIADSLKDYEIRVDARNTETETIKGSDIALQYASQGEVLELLKAQNPFAWVTGYAKQTSYTVETKTTFDRKLLENEVRSLTCAQEENQVPPQNAYVAYTTDGFEIVPETEGSELLVKNAYIALGEAITSDQASIDLTSEPDVYTSAEITSDNESLHQAKEVFNSYANAQITYTFGGETEVLDGNTISSWLTLDSDGVTSSDSADFQQKAAAWVAELAAKYDTVGTERVFQTTNGRTVYVFGTAYGWKIDQAAETEQLIADIQNGGVTSREPIYSMTANGRGENDFGDTYIEVDMGDQHMYYYQNGSIIFDSPIVSGMMADPERQTPTGIYTLYYKSSPEVLRGGSDGEGGYEYETPVTYWMPFNGGVGFHDATWQPYFGGDLYYYYGSHGCINLPYYAAETLYNIIQTGVPIICFY